MGRTNIEWTQETWNPIRGCSRVSEGCRNCYAERVAARFSGDVIAEDSEGKFRKPLPYHGLAKMTPEGPRWTGKVRFVKEHLHDPLRWKRSRRIFVNSMSDLFHENVSEDWIARIFSVMGAAEHHTFQVLTKRPARMLKMFRSARWAAYKPLRNVWLGVSVENQKTADERIPLLLETPAAVRWISAEPLLGPIYLRRHVFLPTVVHGDFPFSNVVAPAGIHKAYFNKYGAASVDLGMHMLGVKPHEYEERKLDWVVVGGESGPGARPFKAEWAGLIVIQCGEAGIPVFVKQLGSYPILDPRYDQSLPGYTRKLRDKKGGDPDEWPQGLRVRQYPEVR